MKDKKKFYVNGEWVNPIKAKDFDVINPSTEEVCAIISLGSSEDTNLAVKSAKSSFIENKLLAPRIKMRIEKNNAAIKVRAIRPMSLPL